MPTGPDRDILGKLAGHVRRTVSDPEDGWVTAEALNYTLLVPIIGLRARLHDLTVRGLVESRVGGPEVAYRPQHRLTLAGGRVL